MHHSEGNLPGDLSSTMKYQRDSLRDFMKYEMDFLFRGIPKLFLYMTAKGRKSSRDAWWWASFRSWS